MNIHNSDQSLFSSAEIRSLTSLTPSSVETSTSATLPSSPFNIQPSNDNVKSDSNGTTPSLYSVNAQGMVVDENMLNMLMMSSVDPSLISNFIKGGEVPMEDSMSYRTPSTDHSSSSAPASPFDPPRLMGVMQDGSVCDFNALGSVQQPMMITTMPNSVKSSPAIPTLLISPPHGTAPSASHTVPSTNNNKLSPRSVVLVAGQKRKKSNSTSSVSSSNKRKLETEPLSPLTAEGLLSNGFESCPQLSPDEERSLKRQRRLVKNREAAQQFRQRQKNYISDLENKVEELSALNTEYASKMELMASENKIIREQLTRLHDFVAQALPGRQVPFPLMYVPPPPTSPVLATTTNNHNNHVNKDDRTSNSSTDSTGQTTPSPHMIHSMGPFSSPLLNMGAMHMHHAGHMNMMNTGSMDNTSSFPVDYHHGFPFSFYPHFGGMSPAIAVPAHMSAPHYAAAMMNSMQCNPMSSTNNNAAHSHQDTNMMPSSSIACEQSAT